MTFTMQIKDELCKLPIPAPCCREAECLGLLLYSAQFSPERIRMRSESAGVRKRVRALFAATFGLEPAGEDNLLEISSELDIRKIFGAFGFEYKNAPLQLNRAVIEDDCCKSAFLRGVFLMGGYVSASGKGYHLELVTSHYQVSRQVSSLLHELEMPAGSVLRRGNHVLYCKDSAVIEDFLTAAGATHSAMELMLKKVERDLRNRVNRKVNCDTANLSKTIDAAAKQIEAIEKLTARGVLDSLPKVLKETAEIRLENPEMSLSELCELFDPPISRPGLSGRIRRILEYAREGESGQ